MPNTIIIYTFLFVVGACVGSFLNVCIYRLPRKESIVFPRSYCPRCRKIIPWYDNVPLASYIKLGGACRWCKGAISPVYFWVELVTAVLFVSLFYHFGWGLKFLFLSAFGCALIAATFIDMEHKIIPDEISIYGMIGGLLLSVFYPPLLGEVSYKASAINSLIGIIVGGGLIYLAGLLGKILFKREAMGGGDIKYMAMIGAFLGWKKIIMAFFIAPIFGAIVGIAIAIKEKTDVIPYGPFLSLGGLIALLWGEEILRLIAYSL